MKSTFIILLFSLLSCGSVRTPSAEIAAPMDFTRPNADQEWTLVRVRGTLSYKAHDRNLRFGDAQCISIGEADELTHALEEFDNTNVLIEGYYVTNVCGGNTLCLSQCSTDAILVREVKELR